MARDKRVKGCPNSNCKKNKNKYHYKAEDQFCSVCGSQLVFVCAKCFSRISDDDSSHRICERCEAGRGKAAETIVKLHCATNNVTSNAVEFMSDNVGKPIVTKARQIKENSFRK